MSAGNLAELNIEGTQIHGILKEPAAVEEGPDGEPASVVGKYLTIWKKQVDGRWMVSADMFNADAPPSAS